MIHSESDMLRKCLHHCSLSTVYILLIISIISCLWWETLLLLCAARTLWKQFILIFPQNQRGVSLPQRHRRRRHGAGHWCRAQLVWQEGKPCVGERTVSTEQQCTETQNDPEGRGKEFRVRQYSPFVWIKWSGKFFLLISPPCCSTLKTMEEASLGPSSS